MISMNQKWVRQRNEKSITSIKCAHKLWIINIWRILHSRFKKMVGQIHAKPFMYRWDRVWVCVCVFFYVRIVYLHDDSFRYLFSFIFLFFLQFGNEWHFRKIFWSLKLELKSKHKFKFAFKLTLQLNSIIYSKTQFSSQPILPPFSTVDVCT